MDDDVVDLTNLQRQIAHTTARVGQPKVDSIAQAVHAINPQVQMHTVQPARADAALLVAAGRPGRAWCWTAADNYATRHAINAACVRQGGRWWRAQPSALMARSPVVDPRGAASALLRLPVRARRRSLKKCSAPPWACSPRWSA